MTINTVATYKAVMRNYPTGVAIVTTVTEHGEPVGLTVNSFASVSIDPILILWSIDKNVSSYDLFTKTEQFAVHILAADQEELAMRFATKGTDRFRDGAWERSASGLPILADVAGVLHCKTYQTIEVGDHTTLIGEVVAIDHADKAPLLYHNRTFGRIPSAFYGAD